MPLKNKNAGYVDAILAEANLSVPFESPSIDDHAQAPNIPPGA